MITRAALVDVLLPELPSGRSQSCTVRARAVDAVDDVVARSAGFVAEVAGRTVLIGLSGAAAMPEGMRSTVIGASAASGLRGRTAALASGDSEQRLLRRLFWEMPITLRIAGQHTVIEEMGASRSSARIPLDFVDQCSGWRSGGEVLTRIAAADGVLSMELGPERPEPAPAERWLPNTEPRSPLSMRRSRVLSIAGSEVSLTHRDWYADANGVVRALHEWNVEARLDLTEDGPRFADVRVTGGQLPWRECPSAGGSGSWLDGRSPAEIDATISEDFLGIATCTHLNDALRMFADVPDLLELSVA
ncbi:MAG TPA: DUF2889 domain-containing protein [Jatrophihabitans sp.]|jgi:hypothetical protein